MTDHLTEQQEWDAILAEIPLESTTGEAAQILAAKLADAVQAQRPWAKARQREAMLTGLGRAWRSHVQKQKPKVRTKNGSVKQVGGVRRTRTDGNVVHLQLPFSTMTFEEIEQHLAMETANLSSLAENTRALKRLLKLRDLCPAASTPAEACKTLDLNPADVMAGAA